MSGQKRICLVGAGSIAETHAAAIAALPGLSAAAVIEPDAARRARFAERWKIADVYASVDAALTAGEFDAAHILTPPDFHSETARPFLAAGIDALVEKPLAASALESDALIAAAMQGGARLGVNQNFIFDPAFARMKERLDSGEIGPLRHLACVYHAPLRQLDARQFGHWMFQRPENILLEQAVHPLSQIRFLAGVLGEFTLNADPLEYIGGGAPFLRSFTASIMGEKCSVSLRFAVGETFPVWRLEAFGTDGALVADIYQSRCYAFERTQWLEAVDQPVSALRTAGGIFGASIANTMRYGLSQLRLLPRSDPFFRAMLGSISAFHTDDGAPYPADGVFGRELVDLCERMTKAVMPSAPSHAERDAATKPLNVRPADVAVLGGTGFIGAHTVAALLAAGYSVRVIARNTINLDPVFASDNVEVVKGDIRNKGDVEGAVGGARFVINLAHGGGGTSYEEVREGMLGGAETVANVCLDRGVSRLLHVGSIAALYLGPDAGVVGDDTTPDPQAEKRADYARAKADTDNRMIELHNTRGVPVVLVRPGLVVGAGTSPLHSGLGLFNNPQHCSGWNSGNNPLPFVLASDVADALVKALDAPEIDGKSYNLVGDVRPTARAYLFRLADETGRPLRFHANAPAWLWSVEAAKWLVKRVGGRRVPFPHRRDILSRGLCAPIDCSAAKADLSWAPETDSERFFAAAFGAERAGPRADRRAA